MRAFVERAAIFAAILVAAYVVTVAADAPAQRGGLVGRPAPDFVATGVTGASVTLADVKGHPVWLTFFSSWCTYCRAENPDIQAIYDEQQAAGGDLVVLGVGVGETKTTASDYARVAGLTFPLAADAEESVARRYNVLAVPTHVFIDRGGVVREIRIGTLTLDAMRSAVAVVTEAPQ